MRIGRSSVLLSYTLLIAVALALTPLPTNARVEVTKADWKVVAPGQPVPEGYSTYSLFLVCNPEWLVGEKEELVTLYESFLAFGRLIGPDNLAVWFSDTPPTVSDQAGLRVGSIGIGGAKSSVLARPLDIERSAFFCKHFELDFAKSPTVVLTSSHPLNGIAAEHFKLELGGRDADEVTRLLVKLTNRVAYWELQKYDPHDRAFWRFWQVAFIEINRGVQDFTDRFEVTFATNFLKVTVD